MKRNNCLGRRLLGALVALCLLLALAPTGVISFGTEAAEKKVSVFSVKYEESDRLFTVSRTDTSFEEKCTYYTESESAVAGIHYTAASGTLVFRKGESSAYVRVQERLMSQIPTVVDRYQNADRTYRFVVCSANGIKSYATRTISYGDDYKIDTKYMSNYSITEYKETVPYTNTSRSEQIVQSSGYLANGVNKVDLSAFYKTFGTNGQTYLTETNAKLNARVEFQVCELADGYQYIQILTDNSTTADECGGMGDPGVVNKSVYMAGFAQGMNVLRSSYYRYAFPVRGVPDNYGRIDGAWNNNSFYPMNNTVGTLIKHRFKAAENRSSLGEYVVVPTSVNELDFRFNANSSSGNFSYWYLKDLIFYAKVTDQTAPKAVALAKDPGTYIKGEEMTLSVRFSEIVKVWGTPTLTTNIGTFTYAGGSGTTALYFRGTVEAETANEVTVTAINGNIGDLASNKLDASSLPLSQSVNVVSAKPQGDGTAENPYKIYTVEELYWFAGLVNGTLANETKNLKACAILMNDITVNPGMFDENGTYTPFASESVREWTPMGRITSRYQGTFDGDGNSVTGLYCGSSNAMDASSLFGTVAGSTIKNLTVKNSYFKGKTRVAGIAGDSYSDGVFENCVNEATVVYDSNGASGESIYFGGIVGRAYGGEIKNCRNSGSVTGNSRNGGIAGYAFCASITNCANEGRIIGDRFVGGILGSFDGGSEEKNAAYVSACANFGDVSGGDKYIGGICGKTNAYGAVKGCFVSSSVTGGSCVGGVVGENASENSVSYNAYDSAKCNLSGSGDETTVAKGFAPAQFASGEVAYYINNGLTDGTQPWYQNIDSGTADAYPVTDNTHATVYPILSYDDDGFTDKSEIEGYTNEPLIVYKPATLVSNSNYKSFGLEKTYVGYYAIENAGQLYWFADSINNGSLPAKTSAVLVNDITINTGDLNNYDGGETSWRKWTPMNGYNGVFDGNSKVIRGLFVTDESAAGLIGISGNDARVKKLGIENSYFSGSEYAGSVCGNANEAIIEACYNHGTVVCTGSGYAGGIVGYGGDVGCCYNVGKVTSNGNVGVIASSPIRIYRCYALKGSGNGGGITFVDEKTFASGEVAYLLNLMYPQAEWRQNVDNDLTPDPYPVFSSVSEKVYLANTYNRYGYANGNEYSNGTDRLSSYQPTTLVTEENYESLGLEADYIGYYAIGNAGQLYRANEDCGTDKHVNTNYVLLADIYIQNDDIAGYDGTSENSYKTWTPMCEGKWGRFAGTFDGRGHKISGLFVKEADSAGLFAKIGRDGCVKHLEIDNSYFYGKTYAGAIAGNFDGGNSVSNCLVSATVVGEGSVGGIFGYCYISGGSLINNCLILGTVKAADGATAKVCGDVGEYSSGFAYPSSNSYVVHGVCEDSGSAIFVSPGQLESGNVTVLLNRGVDDGTQYWYQNIDNDRNLDLHPCLDRTHGTVYYDRYQYDDNGFAKESVSNHAENTSEYLPATLVTEENFAQLGLDAGYIGYYAISNGGQFYWFGKYVGHVSKSANGVLMRDIEINDGTVFNDDGSVKNSLRSWPPTETSALDFYGTLDGRNHTVSGLYVYDTVCVYIGLFEYTENAYIKNIGIVNSYLASNRTGGSRVGTFVGEARNTVFENCYSTARLTASMGCGGIVAYSSGNEFKSCYFAGEILCQRDIENGGLASVRFSEIPAENCFWLDTECTPSDYGTSATAEQFASGEITYRLNGCRSEGTDDSPLVWRQTIGEDSVPGFNGMTVYFSDGKYMNIGENTDLLNFRSATIKLESDISVYFYVPEANLGCFKDVSCAFFFDGEYVGDVSDYETVTLGGVLCRAYVFSGVRATDMTVPIEAVLCGTTANGTSYGRPVEYSVRTYAMNTLARTDDEKLKTLLVDLLNYGAAAQEYFDYYTEDLANALLTEEQKAFGTSTDPVLESKTEIIPLDGETKVNILSATLRLREKVTLLFNLSKTDYDGNIEDLNVRVRYIGTDGQEKVDIIRYGDENLVETETGLTAEFSKLNAVQMRTVVSVTVYENDTPISSTAVYSIESYAASKVGDTDTALAALVKAMMRYGDSGENYFKK